MKTALLVCFLTLLCGMPLYLAYWQVFRPVVLRRLKYRLFQARDDLRLLVINREIGEHEKAYPVLERRCKIALGVIEHLDLADLILCKPSQENVLRVKQEIEIIEESGSKTRQIHEAVRSAVFGAVLVNSPGLLVMIAPILVASVVSYWFARVKAMWAATEQRTWGALYEGVQPDVACS
jgi:hypothetical protein